MFQKLAQAGLGSLEGCVFFLFCLCVFCGFVFVSDCFFLVHAKIKEHLFGAVAYCSSDNKTLCFQNFFFDAVLGCFKRFLGEMLSSVTEEGGNKCG